MTENVTTRRSKRATARSAQLTEQDIIDTAMRMVRRSDASQLSIRALAKELGVTPMAIYHYVPTKAALLDRVREAVLAMVPGVSAPRKRGKAKGEEPLSEQRVVQAAMQVIQRSSVEALTMRAVASELGVSAMALYYHVSNKETLIDRVQDAVLSQLPLPPPQGSQWDVQLKAHALSGITQLAAYPGLLAYGVNREPTPIQLKLGLHGIDILLAAGFDERSAALAITAFNMCILGTISMQARFRGARPARPKGKPRPRLNGRLGVIQYMRDLEFLESIEYGIDTLISGLRLRHADARARAARRRRP